MTGLPNLGSLSLGELAGYLFPLAALVFLAGIGKALASATVLWTYVAQWLVSWLLPAFVLLATAAVGQGIPGWITPNVAVSIVFGIAAAAYVAAAVASIARSLGVDMSRLPFASNAELVFPGETRK